LKSRDNLVAALRDQVATYMRPQSRPLRELVRCELKLEANPSKPEYIVTVHGLGYKFLG